MNTSINTPDPIKRIRGEGFVDYTITRRLPKILSTIEKQLQDHRQLEAAQRLLQSVMEGSPIDTKIFSCPTAYWENYLDHLSRLTWNDPSFFDLEFLFYHGLNSIAGYFDNGVDVFWPTRQRALAEAIPALDSGLEKILQLSDTDLLKATIRCSLFANEADYSQLITSRSDSNLWNDRVLLDESDEFISCLEQHPVKGDIHIIADNAGHELCWDLVMVDALLRSFNNIRVIIHVKPWPMFVSDALSIDVEETLNRFVDENLSEGICLMGQRLRSAMDCDRLLIQAEADWGEPRHFSALNDDLSNTLSNSTIVISKGDLNYRRFVQDRQWPMDTPVEIATDGVPFKALALRVLKSDALVGIDLSIAETAAAKFDNWRTRGHFAVIQSLG
ncbi:ARMT1-like domain-containing protein [Leptothoe sp. EHU-05/26/07-4]